MMEPLFIFYNRVPKSGSATVNELLRRLSVRNRFEYISSRIHDKERLFGKDLDDLNDWIRSRLDRNITTVFDRHIHYMDMDRFAGKVIYINFIRDPVDRFVSAFYYLRYNLRTKKK